MAVTELPKSKTLDMVYIAMFAILIAVCAWISIPAAVPFTLQTFGIFVTVGILGGRRGTLSVLIYLLLGIIGIPVFAGFKSGLGVLMSNTGGYLLGFLLIALLMWAMEKALGKKTWVLALSMVLGLFVCYIFGTAWFMVVYAKSAGEIGIWTVLGWCVIPFVVPDLVKIALALLICNRLAKVIRIN
ncbi:MAG: biotin transporter BioY [Lachnospiraceae bacterium]|nr:biotin transporter BioY [Lachnospiraceae bacterium]